MERRISTTCGTGFAFKAFQHANYQLYVLVCFCMNCSTCCLPKEIGVAPTEQTRPAVTRIVLCFPVMGSAAMVTTAAEATKPWMYLWRHLWKNDTQDTIPVRSVHAVQVCIIRDTESF